MELQGYPQVVIFIVLGLGLPLAFVRPYTAFLLALALLTGGHVTMFNQTRTTALGPYLNLTDACILVAITAFLFDRFVNRRPIVMPEIVPLLLFVLIIAVTQSLWMLGWTYDTQRTFRWALQFPLVYFLGANLVSSTKRLRLLMATVLCGAIVASIGHLSFMVGVWRMKSLDMQTYQQMRTISYWGGCMGAAFLISATTWRLPTGVWKKGLCVSGGLLLMASIFLNMTRSLWIAMIASIPCILVLFDRRRAVKNLVRFGATVLPVAILLVWVCQQLMPGLDIVYVATDRLGMFSGSSGETVHIGTRARAFNAEMSSWMEGTLFFGRGLCFFQDIVRSEDLTKNVAYGHLGYVTYLSQLGLIGLLIYGLYLPLGVIRDSRFLWHYGQISVLRYAGLLGAASIICMSLMFVMSSHFLGLGYEAPAALYGALWAMARRNELAEVLPQDDASAVH